MTARRLKRIKRRVLRQAFEDNVRTIRGLVPAAARPLHRALRVWQRRTLLLLAPVALLSSGWLATGAPRPWLARAQAPATAAASAAAPAAESAALVAAAPTFAAPRPFDPAVFPLAVRRIVLDAGHGGESTGTRVADGLTEKEVTLAVTLELRRQLVADGFEVTLTREADTTVQLVDRASFANRASSDLFVSIHVNWFERRESRGVETYYLGATEDPYLLELAAAENRDSGYSLSDLRRLLDGIYAGVRQEESRKLGEAVQRQLYRSMKRVNPALSDRGVKTAPFLVLVATDMPAILCEVSCLSNREEARLLATPEYRATIAGALAEGIRTYARTRSEGTPRPSLTTNANGHSSATKGKASEL